MKAHIGVYADTCKVHAVSTTAANEHDLTQAHAPLHGQETDVFVDSGYRGVDKREEVQDKEHQSDWHMAKMPGKRKALNQERERGRHAYQLERLKADIQAKVEHLFGVIKRQLGFTKVEYKGLAKNMANVVTLFALNNPWIAQGLDETGTGAGVSASENRQEAPKGKKKGRNQPQRS